MLSAEVHLLLQPGWGQVVVLEPLRLPDVLNDPPLDLHRVVVVVVEDLEHPLQEDQERVHVVLGGRVQLVPPLVDRVCHLRGG